MDAPNLGDWTHPLYLNHSGLSRHPERSRKGTGMSSILLPLKLFFESETEDRGADFYLNIDVKDSSVQFREKDTDYRRGIVLSLLSP